MFSLTCSAQFDPVVHENSAGNDDGLGDLQAVDSSVDIDRIRAENSSEHHINVVDEAQVDGETEVVTEGLRNDYIRRSIVRDKQRHCGNEGEEDLEGPT